MKRYSCSVPNKSSLAFSVIILFGALVLASLEVPPAYYGNRIGVELIHSIGYSSPVVYGFLPHIQDFPASDIVNQVEKNEINGSLARPITRANVVQRSWGDLAALPPDLIQRDPLMRGDGFARLQLASYIASVRNQPDEASQLAYMSLLASKGRADIVDYNAYYQQRISVKQSATDANSIYENLRYAALMQSSELVSKLQMQLEWDQEVIDLLDVDQKALVYNWFGISAIERGLNDLAKSYWWRGLSERNDFAPAMVSLATLPLSSDEVNRLCDVFDEALRSALAVKNVSPNPSVQAYRISFLDPADFDEGLSSWFVLWKNSQDSQKEIDCLSNLQNDVLVLRQRNLLPEGAFAWTVDYDGIELGDFWGRMYNEPEENRALVVDDCHSFARLHNTQATVRTSLQSRKVLVQPEMCYLLTARLRAGNKGRGTIVTRWFDAAGHELGRGSTIENMVDEDWRRVQSLTISPPDASHAIVWLLNYESVETTVDYDDVAFFDLGDACK